MQATASRATIHHDPFPDPLRPRPERGEWPARWIGHEGIVGQHPVVLGFRRKIDVDQPTTFRAHVTADERYELFLNGKRIGRGSERGDRRNWFYETYDFTLPPGEHLLVARTWWLGPQGPSPCAQISLQPGFLFAAEEPSQRHLGTGQPGWESKVLSGYEFHWPSAEIFFPGARFKIKGSEIDWDITHQASVGWKEAVDVGPAISAATAIECPDHICLLRPGTLPPMLDKTVHAGVVRHIGEIVDPQVESLPIHAAAHLAREAGDWNSLLKGNSSVLIPAHTKRRILIDLENYFCAYSELTVSGGKNAFLRVGWAESLYEESGFVNKGNRRQTEGKYFRGFFDIFEPDGGTQRTFAPLWWMAGRYVEIIVITAAEALWLNAFQIQETHYPYVWKGTFQSSDKRLNDLWPLFQRSLEMCSHETYMDCPYYEQLMYVGDTRLEILQTYAMTDDDRLPRKAISLFDASRLANGLTQSRYPCRITQVISPFSLWWIGMVHDFLYWRDNPAFVKDCLPGVRAVMEAFRRYLNPDHLIERSEGWNFVDWVPEWEGGVPPDSDIGVSGAINLQAVLAFLQAAELEQFAGETELAARNRRCAEKIFAALTLHFWNEQRGLFADDRAHLHFSEHAQCLALLAGLLDEPKKKRIVAGLCDPSPGNPALTCTTIYFSHYLLEACASVGRIDRVFDRLESWFELRRLDLKTTVEMGEPTRSDCHAWGSHPAFHCYASILGIRPDSPCFSTVRIAPQLGHLTHVAAAMPHPKGIIEVHLGQESGNITGVITLPEGLSGSLIVEGETHALSPGNNYLDVATQGDEAG